MASAAGLDEGTNLGQRAAVASTMRLLGERAPARFVPTDAEDEVWFVLPGDQSDDRLRDAEQVLTQLLGRKVWITPNPSRYEISAPFPT